MSDNAAEDTQKSNRDSLGRFAKGHTINGNPGGRPKVSQEVTAIACRNSVAVINELVDLALHHPDPNIRISASKLVLDRAIGKVPYTVAVQGGLEHRHFVLRAPPVLPSAEEWELKYGVPAIEVKPNPVHERSDCAVAAAESDEPA